MLLYIQLKNSKHTEFMEWMLKTEILHYLEIKECGILYNKRRVEKIWVKTRLQGLGFRNGIVKGVFPLNKEEREGPKKAHYRKDKELKWQE